MDGAGPENLVADELRRAPVEREEAVIVQTPHLGSNGIDREDGSVGRLHDYLLTEGAATRRVQREGTRESREGGGRAFCPGGGGGGGRVMPCGCTHPVRTGGLEPVRRLQPPHEPYVGDKHPRDERLKWEPREVMVQGSFLAFQR